MNDVDISLILPVFNEGDHLAQSLQVILGVIDSVTPSYEVILVNDGSQDSTWDIVTAAAAANPKVRGVSFSRNLGKESAILAGLRHAAGRAVILMDADLQHPPMLIPEMVRLWREEKYDIVNARKSWRGRENAVQRMLAKSFYAIYAALTGANIRNASDFKLMDRRVVTLYGALEERNLFFRGLIPWMGFRQADVMFEVQDRAGGGTKWPPLRRLLLGMDAITSFSSVPLQLVTLCGFTFMLAAVAMILQTFFVWMSGEAVEGFTTVIILLLVIGGLLMLSLGIIGQYLARIYQEIKRRPHYIVRDKIGLRDDAQAR